jgi:hypothetical protein
VVGADHEFRRRVVDVGDVGLEPGQPPGLGLQVTVDGPLATGESDEPVAFDRPLAGDDLLGLGDLLVDAAQSPTGPVGRVLVVDDVVAALVGGAGRPPLGEHLTIGHVPVRVILAPPAHHVGEASARR